MPTYNRRAFVPHAIRYFLRQDYHHTELIIIDDGTDNVSELIPDIENIRYYRLDKKITLGAKMNLACSYARGNIIANWDDDDWYSERRLSYQVNALQQRGVAVCGINDLFYFDIRNKQGFRYIYPANQRVWLLGSSLCFTKELWRSNTFADINVGMDGLFVWATSPDRVKVLEDSTFSVHMIHNDNISPKNTNGGYWHIYPVENLQKIMDSDWKYYSNDNFYNELKSIDLRKTNKQTVFKCEYKLLKNIYACLVHENEDSIIDLVRNLRYHDPTSVILLYNGSGNPQLLRQHYPYERYGVIIHPNPVPQNHGYLHTFALDCMEYALEKISFDILTIVDSDQLTIRSGYSAYLSQFFASASNVGMLSSMPERILPDNKINHVAVQIFKEYDLWKPLFSNFPEKESEFVHWTFWPSTVFKVSAIRDLVALFKENDQLKEIMRYTKIWATEEVIFPTLIRFLGYEIAKNPCSYDFVKYKQIYTAQDINSALNKTDAYWMHPIERRYENPLRTYIRKQFNEYAVNEDPKVIPERSGDTIFKNSVLINGIKQIEGWLDDNEADLLIEITRKVCKENKGIHGIVEIGSYHGKSTVLFGSILKEYLSSAKVYAIDTHDGKLGAIDQGLKSFAPSFISFQRNIEKAGISDIVESIKDRACNVKWQLPISILFIDGLHDYPNVARDFWHFDEWIIPGGYIAFHDYADYYPGVQAFVNELLNADTYIKVQKAHSLVVLKKHK